jgi:hypothetical protein
VAAVEATLDERKDVSAPSEVTVRPMREDDVPELAVLKRQIFGARRASEASWRHKYFEAPWGIVPGVVAERDGRIVGALGRMLRPFKFDGMAVMGALGGDLMLAPELRGIGLRQRMNAVASPLAISLGAEINYGFANRQSEPPRADRKRYWGNAVDDHTLGFHVPAYLKVLRPRALLNATSPDTAPATLRLFALTLAKARPALPVRNGKLDHAWTRELPEGVDELWAKSAPRARYQLVRDAEYMRYRYEKDPAMDYAFLAARRAGELAGLAVASEDEFAGARGLVVGDWLVENREPSLFAALLDSAVQRARAHGLSFVLLRTLPPFGRVAQRQGFWRLPAGLDPNPMQFSLRWAPASMEPRELCDARNWWMTFGDSDVF